MRLLMKLVFIFLMASQLPGCSSPDPTVCVTGTSCAFTGGTWETCCSSTECELRTPGVDFPCLGTNCSGAAAQLAVYCAGPAKTVSNTESELLKALVIEKTNNVLLRKSIDDLYIDLGKEVQQGNP